MTHHILPADFDTEAEEVFTARSAARQVLGGRPNRHLTALDAAQPGDLVAMIGGFRADFETGGGLETVLEGFLVAGEKGLKLVSYYDVPERNADSAAHLVAEQLFLQETPHKMVVDFNMVDLPVGYQLQTVQFTDAVLYISMEWILGWIEEDTGHELHPVVFEMAAATNMEEAQACVAKARRYLDIVHQMLPEQHRNQTNWDIILPRPEDFLSKWPGLG